MSKAILPQHRPAVARRLAFDEDLEFLLAWGTAHVDIRTRLNAHSFSNLEKRLERHQRKDLLAQLQEVPPESRNMAVPSAAELRTAENDRLFKNLMAKARFEADRARRGIPAHGERSIRIVRTNRSVPVLQEVA